ncbi:MAG: AraC family transcriptional regulator of adaptative response [Rhodothermales bacterium]
MDIGMSGPGRLHDLLVTTEAVTPGQMRASGQGLSMNFGVGETPFGTALIAWTDRGVNFLGFCHQHGQVNTFESLKDQWPSVILREESKFAQDLLNDIFDNPKASPIKVWLRGSPFQLKVWEALLKIPPSAHCSYGQIAQHIGKPGASRAIGTAIGRNPVSWLIPCHRVITSMGTMGGYRWGVETKLAMIGVESARSADMNEARIAI